MGPEGVTNCLMAATRFVLVRIGYDVWNLLPAYQRNIYRTSEPVSSMETGTSVNLSVIILSIFPFVLIFGGLVDILTDFLYVLTFNDESKIFAR